MSNFDLTGMLNANARRFAALATKFIAASSSYKTTPKLALCTSLVSVLIQHATHHFLHKN